MIQDQVFFKKVKEMQNHKSIFDGIYFDSLKGFDYHCLNISPNSIFQFINNRLIKGYSLFGNHDNLKILFNLPDLDKK